MLDESARSSQRVGTPRPDRGHTVIGLDHVTISRHHEERFRIGQQEHRLEFSQHPIRSPITRQFDRSTPNVSRVRFEFPLEPFHQRQRVRHAAGKSDEGPTLRDPTYFLSALFHDRLSECNLTVGRQRDLTVAKNGDHRGRSDAVTTEDDSVQPLKAHNPVPVLILIDRS